MSNEVSYRFYYDNPKDHELGKLWIPSPKAAWIEDPVWLNVACYIKEGKPISIKADKCILYEYKKSGLLSPKFVLVGPANANELNRVDGLEIIPLGKPSKKLNYESFLNNSKNGSLSVNNIINCEYKVSEENSHKRYKELYEKAHNNIDVVSQMIQSLVAAPMENSEFGFEIQSNGIRYYKGKEWGYYPKNSLAAFANWGMQDLPDRSVDLKVALADMILEYVCSTWIQINNSKDPTIEMNIDYDWMKVRVHFTNNITSEPTEDPNLKAW